MMPIVCTGGVGLSLHLAGLVAFLTGLSVHFAGLTAFLGGIAGLPIRGGGGTGWATLPCIGMATSPWMAGAPCIAGRPLMSISPILVGAGLMLPAIAGLTLAVNIPATVTSVTIAAILGAAILPSLATGFRRRRL